MQQRNPSPHRKRDSSGFTLVEVVISIAILALVGVAATAVSLAGVVRMSDESLERQNEATTAQWMSVKFARDVQGASEIAPECAPGAGTRLITFAMSDGSASMEYRVRQAGDGTFAVWRGTCGANPAKVVDGLADAPTVTCDGAACSIGSRPRVVTIDVDRSDSFEFELDGARRMTDGNSIDGPREAPTFMSVGGSKPLHVQGSAQLRVQGSAYINRPESVSPQAITFAGSPNREVLEVTGDFRIEQGATCQGGCIKANKVPGTFNTPIPDPLRFVPPPDTTVMLDRTDCPTVSGVRRCQPGVYTTSFPPSGGGGGGVKDFVLEPGVYVLKAGMTMRNGSMVSNGGVLLYNGDDANQACDAVDINGGEFDLTPHTTGVYAGILFFQGRYCTSPIEISGNADLASLSGAIYAPGSSSVVLGGGSGTLKVGRVIGANLEVFGNGTVIVGGS